MSVPWRVGQHYQIHVYEGDRPVATFHTAIDAWQAVRDHNAAADLCEAVERGVPESSQEPTHVPDQTDLIGRGQFEEPSPEAVERLRQLRKERYETGLERAGRQWREHTFGSDSSPLPDGEPITEPPPCASCGHYHEPGVVCLSVNRHLDCDCPGAVVPGPPREIQ